MIQEQKKRKGHVSTSWWEPLVAMLVGFAIGLVAVFFIFEFEVFRRLPF